MKAQQKLPEESDSTAEDVAITYQVPASGKAKKNRKLILSDREIKLIHSNKMLTDESINLGQQYLKEDFPGFAGFFDTALLKWNDQDIIPTQRRYVQIVNLGNSHWVCVSSTSKSKNSNQTHDIWDSLSRNKVSDELKKTISEYSFCKEENLELILKPVQQQTNGVDCGVYCLAVATALVHAVDPCLVAFDETKMRDHLVQCLQQKNMTLFPTTSKRVRRCITKKTIVPIFCRCRKPYFEGENMVQCTICKEWFHFKCEKIPKSRNLTNTNWRCTECKP